MVWKPLDLSEILGKVGVKIFKNPLFHEDFGSLCFWNQRKIHSVNPWTNDCFDDHLRSVRLQFQFEVILVFEINEQFKTFVISVFFFYSWARICPSTLLNIDMNQSITTKKWSKQDVYTSTTSKFVVNVLETETLSVENFLKQFHEKNKKGFLKIFTPTFPKIAERSIGFQTMLWDSEMFYKIMAID